MGGFIGSMLGQSDPNRREINALCLSSWMLVFFLVASSSKEKVNSEALDLG